MPNVVGVGLTSLKIGAIAADGGMGTTLAAVGKTFKDSCQITEEDGELTEWYSEEDDDPLYSKQAKGKFSIAFQIMDADADALLALKGGTVSGTAPKVWSAPTTAPNIEKSIEITLTTGQKVQIVRGRIVAKLSGTVGKSGIVLVDVTITALTPTKAATPPLMWTNAS